MYRVPYIPEAMKMLRKGPPAAMRGVTTPSLRWMIATIWILMSKLAARAQFAAKKQVAKLDILVDLLYYVRRCAPLGFPPLLWRSSSRPLCQVLVLKSSGDVIVALSVNISRPYYGPGSLPGRSQVWSDDALPSVHPRQG